MHNQSYRFSLFVIWCCLLSISNVTLFVIVAKWSKQSREYSLESKDTSGEGGNLEGGGAHVAKHLAGPERSSVDHISLVWAENDISQWTHSSSCFCDNTSLILKNDTVIITTRGFYSFYAQVTFRNNEAHKTVGHGTVTLVANENVPRKTARKLREAEHGNGTVSMSGVFLLRKDDRLKLNISPDSLVFLRDASKTNWGLFLLAKHDNK